MSMLKKIVGSLVLVSLLGAGAALFFYTRSSHDTDYSLKKLRHHKNIVPVVVIGSGPAGLSAALYTARAGLYTVVFQGKTPGGQLTSTTHVENWPGVPNMLGPALMQRTQAQAQTFGALMVSDSIKSVDLDQWPYQVTTEEGHTLTALTLILATGSNPRLLSQTERVPGEKEYWGYGVTSCAVCDAPFYKGKEVVVIGGGDSAVEEATYLTSFAKKVTLIVRGSSLRSAESMKVRLKEFPQITVLYDTKVTEILGNGTLVTGVRISSSKEKKSSELKTDGVFLAIGHVPNTELIKKWITTDATGTILLNTRTQKTAVPGVFAAGDVADSRYRQAGVAAGDGIKAALDANEFLQEHGFSTAVMGSLERCFYDPDTKKEQVPLTHIVTLKDFDQLTSKHPWIVLDVGAEHCSSCKMLEPVVQSVATKLKDSVHFAYSDLGDNPQELIRRFNLNAIPTLLVFHKGKLVARYNQQLFSVRELYALLNTLIAQHSEKQ